MRCCSRPGGVLLLPESSSGTITSAPFSNRPAQHPLRFPVFRCRRMKPGLLPLCRCHAHPGGSHFTLRSDVHRRGRPAIRTTVTIIHETRMNDAMYNPVLTRFAPNPRPHKLAMQTHVAERKTEPELAPTNPTSWWVHPAFLSPPHTLLSTLITIAWHPGSLSRMPAGKVSFPGRSWHADLRHVSVRGPQYGCVA